MPPPLQQKKLVMGLAGATFIGMPAIAWLIAGWTDVSMYERLRWGAPLLVQLSVGALAGWCIGLLAQWLVDRKFMLEATSKYQDMFGALRLDRGEMIFLAVSAGVGEEILFRGAIQPLLGIWPTAFLFIALHGYLNFKSWRISLYGAVMTVMIALLGYFTEWIGIWSAVAAHAVIDLFLLFQMEQRKYVFKKLE
jgi:membrane protease YdiL (CAAX protease family)